MHLLWISWKRSFRSRPNSTGLSSLSQYHWALLHHMWSNTGVMSLSAPSVVTFGSDWARRYRHTFSLHLFSIPRFYTWMAPLECRVCKEIPGIPSWRPGALRGAGPSELSSAVLTAPWSPPRGRARGGGFCPSILRENASSPPYGNISLGLRSSWSQYLRRSHGLWNSSASSNGLQIC